MDPVTLAALASTASGKGGAGGGGAPSLSASSRADSKADGYAGGGTVRDSGNIFFAPKDKTQTLAILAAVLVVSVVAIAVMGKK